MSEKRELLPHGAEVPFDEISSALAKGADRYRAAQGRALTSTVVAIGPDERLIPAAEALQQLENRIAIRTILIASGHSPAPGARVAGNAIAIPGLKTEFVNNAVAALRLSSLPTLVWFRGGPPEMLDRLADLADRVVLDEPQPVGSWRRASALIEHTAFSDLRWARLTRWRTLMAHFFDIPDIRAAARTFTHLKISGSDPVAADLYAGWLRTALSLPLEFEFIERPQKPAIQEIGLGDHDRQLRLRLVPAGTCVHTTARIRGHLGAARTVTLGDQTLTALIAEELRIRTRDAAFEHAMKACVEAA